MKAVHNKQLEKATLGIFYDYIIWNRVADAMRIANNALFPSQNVEDFEPDCRCRGYSNAFLVLGIENEDDLTDILGGLFFNLMKTNSQESAEKLSQLIYKEWLITIKNYFIEVSNMKSKLVKV